MRLYQVRGIIFRLLIFVLLGKASSESNIIEGVCSYNVSTSGPKVVPASVFSVTFSACWSGKLSWRDPYGGVQITFQSAVPEATLGTYQVCLNAKDFATNIFTRNGNTLKVLRRYEDKHTTSEICVSSQTKEIIIILEATDQLKTRTAVFTYWTSFKRKGKGLLRAKECKRCDQKELIKSFCSSHFAVHGFVKSVIPISAGLERGEAVVVAKEVFHQTLNIFEKSPTSSEILGNVNFPLHCHWKKRVKHGYLFTGNLTAGDGPVIHCRIKFHLWKKLHRKNICKTMGSQT